MSVAAQLRVLVFPVPVDIISQIQPHACPAPIYFSVSPVRSHLVYVYLAILGICWQLTLCLASLVPKSLPNVQAVVLYQLALNATMDFIWRV